MILMMPACASLRSATFSVSSTRDAVAESVCALSAAFTELDKLSEVLQRVRWNSKHFGYWKQGIEGGGEKVER